MYALLDPENHIDNKWELSGQTRNQCYSKHTITFTVIIEVSNIILATEKITYITYSINVTKATHACTGCKGSSGL